MSKTHHPGPSRGASFRFAATCFAAILPAFLLPDLFLPTFLRTVCSAQQTKESAAAGGQDERHSGEHQYPPNRLAEQSSPYLLKHAHNPVSWQPWDETALKQAADENKMIFLSIGYSSCHWCHVMERESFLDEEIAKILNENFVCIKVDREERPDVDTIYMTSLNIYSQLTTGRAGGGWPLSMFLTPDGRPFFGGTYFPARDGDRPGAPGFLTVLNRVTTAWKNSRDRLDHDANQLTEYTRAELDGHREGDGGSIKAAWSKRCLEVLGERFDKEFGGFGYSETNADLPKFPESPKLFFLLDLCESSPESDATLARTILTTTLDHMARGGIYDAIGGGFHRYSVDRYWHIPHFEKMLYDNGQLLSVYSRAWKLSGNEEYRHIAEGIVRFVERELRDADGGFYAALDAESEGVEGKYYRWERAEVEQALEPDVWQIFSKVYSVDGDPNFEEEFYVPMLAKSIGETAVESGMEPKELESQLAASRDVLLKIRQQRVRPNTDTKILTSWNGLMIRGLADAGRIFDRPEWHDMAARAADFVWTNLYIEGRLHRTSTDGDVRLNAYLDDYAFYINGLIALHGADGDARWLERAAELQVVQDELFWAEDHARYYDTSSDHESLLVRTSDSTDGEIPSGSSVSAENLLYLAEALERPELRERARRVVSGSSGLIDDFPAAAPRLIISARELVE